MVTKCPNCGSAVLDEGKFCSYCGAKLPDDTKRVEIKINNTAEIKRAEYEEQESRLRQKKMARDLAKDKRKSYLVLAKLMSIIVPGALALTGSVNGSAWLICIFLSFAFLGVWFIRFLSKI